LQIKLICTTTTLMKKIIQQLKNSDEKGLICEKCVKILGIIGKRSNLMNISLSHKFSSFIRYFIAITAIDMHAVSIARRPKPPLSRSDGSYYCAASVIAAVPTSP
jgi:hypothetical protein